MPFILIILNYIKNNKTVQAIVAIITILILIVSIVGYEIHTIKTKQELSDQLKQEQLYNSALTEQISRDKVTIDKFTQDMETLKKAEAIKKEDLDKIIQSNKTWANETIPSNINGDLNND